MNQIEDTTFQLSAIQQAFEIADERPMKLGELFPNTITNGEVLMRDLTEAFVGDVNTAWMQNTLHREMGAEIIQSQKSTACRMVEKVVKQINLILG
jgi:hypothetical protein